MIVTDQGMPGIHGTNLAREILNIRPRIPIVLLTGYGELIYEQKAADVGIRQCLRKPIDFEKLSDYSDQVDNYVSDGCVCSDN